MKPDQWQTLRRCAQGADLGRAPVALIVDSPWIPGWLGLSTLDYLTVPAVWLEANLAVQRRFPDVIFLPGFWVEMGMTAEPSAFGCKVSFYPDRPPAAHPLGSELGDVEGLHPPNPLTDGFMPVITNYYRQAEARVRDAGHAIKVVAARGPLTVAAHLIGVTPFLLGLKLDPAATHRLLDVTTTLVRTWLEVQAGALSEVEGVLVLDDLAGFLSPKDYLEFAHPYLHKVFAAFPGVLRLFHNDTDNPASYRLLKELGIDIFNFTHLQPLARVREWVGPSLCLMGNVAPLETLAQGTPEQVRLEAAACLAAHPSPRLLLSAGGGVSPGTPADNLDALVAAGNATNLRPGRAAAPSTPNSGRSC